MQVGSKSGHAETCVTFVKVVHHTHHRAGIPVAVDSRLERGTRNGYRDHILDFTRPNVYRGLAGLFPVYEDADALGAPSSRTIT